MTVPNSGKPVKNARAPETKVGKAVGNIQKPLFKFAKTSGSNVMSKTLNFRDPQFVNTLTEEDKDCEFNGKSVESSSNAEYSGDIVDLHLNEAAGWTSDETSSACQRPPGPRTLVVIPAHDPWEEADSYLSQGFSIVPIQPGTKQPFVKWGKYQILAADANQIAEWWRRWPDAGMAAVLGPVSNLIAVDVNGKEAHDELVRRLGAEPKAPKILTGSRKRFRYQLLFRYPAGLKTHAKISPWHPQLEFRGFGGLTVLPPSEDKSGKRLRWAPARSLDEMEVPVLPPIIREALLERVDEHATSSTTGHGETTMDNPPQKTNGQAGITPLPAGAHATLHLSVPDWVLSNWDLTKPEKPSVKRGRPSLVGNAFLFLFMAEIVLQRSSVVRIPDVALAQLAWGGNRAKWPCRWRYCLVGILARLSKSGWGETTIEKGVCPESCPLHGQPEVRHRHVRFRLTAMDMLSFFDLFAISGTMENGFDYDFKGLKSTHPVEDIAKSLTKERRRIRNKGILCTIYLPAWVFGPLTLEPGSCRILKTLTHELTRQRTGNFARPDKAEVVSGTSNALLDSAKQYVAFNGNASRKRPQFHGRGYSLRIWMERSAYLCDPTSPAFRAKAREFIADLKELCLPFGLVVVAKLPGNDRLLTLDEVADEVDIIRPRKLARKCIIQVFGPHDYDSRWRDYFASRLDLGFIPGGNDDECTSSAGGQISSGEELARWMKKSGMTDRSLAKKTGVSRTLVNKIRNAARPMSALFQAKLRQVVDELKFHGSSVTKPSVK